MIVRWLDSSDWRPKRTKGSSRKDCENHPDTEYGQHASPNEEVLGEYGEARDKQVWLRKGLVLGKRAYQQQCLVGQDNFLGRDEVSGYFDKNGYHALARYVGSGTACAMDTADTAKSAKTRLQQSEGMSYAEFSYPLMQAWDWWMLFKQRDIQLQIGGADQFGNIVAGIEGVDSVADQLVDKEIEPTKFGPLAKKFGLTVPLLTTASGEKFGKSAGNAIWLDPEMTPIFEQYQVSILE